MIKDSGDRTEFETGAKRDMHAGKGRMDLLPWYGIMEVSKHCEEGALKYGEHNVDKGIPLHSLLDSASRHLAKYMVGMDDEDHLRAACWNLLWALNQRVTHPELDDRFCAKKQKETKEKKPEWVTRPWRCKYCNHTFPEAVGYWTGENKVAFACPNCGGIERWTPPASLIRCPECQIPLVDASGKVWADVMSRVNLDSTISLKCPKCKCIKIVKVGDVEL